LSCACVEGARFKASRPRVGWGGGGVQGALHWEVGRHSREGGASRAPVTDRLCHLALSLAGFTTHPSPPPPPHRAPPTPTPNPNPQSITSYVDDVLADAVLHGAVPKGGTAFIELDPSTNAPRVWPGRPAPVDLLCPPLDGRSSADRTVGADEDELMPRPGGPGSFPAGAAGAEGGVGSVYVLASGGFDDA
jgi:hypothetical protein